jgi:predicted transcriptional regulator
MEKAGTKQTSTLIYMILFSSQTQNFISQRAEIESDIMSLIKQKKLPAKTLVQKVNMLYSYHH